MGDGFDIEYFGQGFASMTAPTKQLERLVVSKQIAHDGNAVLRWMVSNASVEQDAAGNLKPSKKKSTEKIDGVVAAIMALGIAAEHIEEDTDSPEMFYINL
jgi:phage terminase large subunit-like protein